MLYYIRELQPIIIGFFMAARGRRKGKGFLIALFSKTQIEVCIEQLLSQGRTTTETMNRPLLRRAEPFLELQENIKRTNTMNSEGLLQGFGKRNLPTEHRFLQLHTSSAQAVEPAFSQRHYLRMLQKLFQPYKQSLNIVRFCPPGMNASRIEPTRHGPKRFWLLHNIERQINNGRSWRCLLVVGVEIQVLMC